MTYNPSEIVLPVRNFNWAYTGKQIWLSNPDSTHPIRFNMSAFGYLNAWPTVIAQDNNLPGSYYALQFDAGPTILSRTSMTSNPINKQSTPYFGSDHIMMSNNYQNKGVNWNTILNQPDFFTGLSTGWIATQPDQTLDYICFAEGSGTCKTTNGAGFCATTGFSTNTTRIFDSSAGCPAVNNYGPSLIPSFWNFLGPGSYQSTPMLSCQDGAGTGPLSPLLSTHPDLPYMFDNGVDVRCCDLGNNMVAVLPGPNISGYQHNTVLRVYKWFPLIADGGFSNPNHCSVNKIRIGLVLIYERDLRAFINTAGAVTVFVNNMTSPTPGILITKVCAANFSSMLDAKVLYFRFPGPLVQPIGYASDPNNAFGQGDTTHFLDPQNRICMLLMQSGFIYSTVESLNVRLSYTTPIKAPPPYPVAAMDTNTFINTKRTY